MYISLFLNNTSVCKPGLLLRQGVSLGFLLASHPFAQPPLSLFLRCAFRLLVLRAVLKGSALPLASEARPAKTNTTRP